MMTFMALALASGLLIGSGASGYSIYRLIMSGGSNQGFAIIFIWVPFLAALLSSIIFSIYLEG